MEDDNTYLQYLINEEIYIIQEEHNAGQEPEGKKSGVKIPREKPRLTFNNKTVLLLDYSSEGEMQVEIGELLTKILGSVGLSLPKVERVYRDKIQQLNSESFTGCNTLTFSDDVPVHLGNCFDSQKYVIKSHGTNQFLSCDMLETIRENRNLKKKLWDQLKKLYTVPT